MFVENMYKAAILTWEYTGISGKYDSAVMRSGHPKYCVGWKCL